MDLSAFCDYTIFHGFDELVNWLCGSIPLAMLLVFLLNVVFNILDIIIHFGGKR